MATFSCDSDSSDHAGEIRGGSDAEPAIGTLAPHDVPYAGIGADGTSLDLPSAGVEGEGDSTKGEGDEIGNSMSRPPLEEKREEKDKDEVKKEEKDKEEEEEDKEKEKKEEQKDEKKVEVPEVEDTQSGSKDLKPDKEDDLKLKLKEKEEKANRNTLLLLTMLLVMAIPVVVWRSINQPELVLWRLSLLLCCCCFIWSGLLDVAIVQTMLPIFCSSFFLALYADATQDSKMGALIVHLNSYFAAGMLGYALAERRQRDGTEVSAEAAAAGNPSDKSEAEDLFYHQTLGGVYTILFTLGLALPVAWVVWHRADYPIEELVIYVFLPLSGLLMLWILFVGGMLLQGALIQEAGICLLLMYFFCVGLVFSMVSVLIGEIGAMVYTSLVMLGFPGFFGYSLRVYTSFKLRLKLQLKVDKSTKELPTRSSPVKADEIFEEPHREVPYLETAPSSPGAPSPPSSFW